ncbi:TPA: sensor domain-containing diguanylate cyclase [Klebsiella quasipneumoniae subsp. quasipneumoniae]
MLNIKEENRLLSLYSMGILDTKSEERFDRLTRIASNLFDVPISLVSLVDRDRQWFKSCFGLKITETNRSDSFCTVAVELNEPLIVSDASVDPRFRDNKFVINEPYIRFYAGYPVKLPDGEVAGTICIIDTKPRIFTSIEFSLLRDLAEIVEDEFRIINEATTDALTGICNRRSFAMITDETLRKAKKKKTKFCVIIIDLDNFKPINDNFGHSEGNKALCTFATVLEEYSSTKSIVARLGGDEFGILLPESTYEEAEELITSLKNEISEYNKTSGKKYNIEFSAGIIEYDEEIHTGRSSIMEAADENMYAMKKSKR